MPDTYAQKFADQGSVALAFDYSHYGESAGEPRQLELPAEKLSDLEAAVSVPARERALPPAGEVVLDVPALAADQAARGTTVVGPPMGAGD
ncbi:MAG TPA: hypothetical protein VF517_17350 [Thermoleophilaceae bacterium]|jgi:hypothetical protein